MLAARLISTRGLGCCILRLRGRHPLRNAVTPAQRRLHPAAFSFQQQHHSERVLRYPNGTERRIRYPTVIPDTDIEVLTSSSDPYQSFAEEAQPDRWHSEDWADDVPGLWMGLFDQEPLTSSAQAASAPAVPHVPLQQGTADPMEVLQQLTSSSYKEAQQQYWEQIGSSYQVLDGCPWLLPKPLYVLAVPQAAAPQAAMFTMRTRVPQQPLESELSKVLGRRRADGGHLISVDSMVEGIVCFEDETDAEQFGLVLEADGHQDVSLAECDSHSLFRLSTSSATVVVLLKQGARVPTPGELEVSLQRQVRPIMG